MLACFTVSSVKISEEWIRNNIYLVVITTDHHTQKTTFMYTIRKEKRLDLLYFWKLQKWTSSQYIASCRVISYLIMYSFDRFPLMSQLSIFKKSSCLKGYSVLFPARGAIPAILWKPLKDVSSINLNALGEKKGFPYRKHTAHKYSNFTYGQL